MPTLYDLTGRYLELWELADQSEDGEIDPDLAAAIAENDDALADKADGYCRVIRNLESTAAACKAEEKRLADRRKSIEKNVGRLKESLQYGMETLGTDKIKTDLFSVTIALNPPKLYVEDESLIPRGYFIRPLPELVRAAVKDALVNGNEVPGASLVRGKSLRIR